MLCRNCRRYREPPTATGRSNDLVGVPIGRDRWQEARALRQVAEQRTAFDFAIARPSSSTSACCTPLVQLQQVGSVALLSEVKRPRSAAAHETLAPVSCF